MEFIRKISSSAIFMSILTVLICSIEAESHTQSVYVQGGRYDLGTEVTKTCYPVTIHICGLNEPEGTSTPTCSNDQYECGPYSSCYVTYNGKYWCSGSHPSAGYSISSPPYACSSVCNYRCLVGSCTRCAGAGEYHRTCGPWNPQLYSYGPTTPTTTAWTTTTGSTTPRITTTGITTTKTPRTTTPAAG